MKGVYLFSKLLKDEIFERISKKDTWEKEELKIEILETLADISAKYADLITPTSKNLSKNIAQDTFLSSLEESEREKILQVLKLTMWNQSEAAKMLGIDRKTIRNKIQRYGLHSDV